MQRYRILMLLAHVTIAVLCTTFAGGCQEQNGRADVVHVQQVVGQPFHTQPVIDEASEILGLELVVVNMDNEPVDMGVVTMFVDDRAIDGIHVGATTVADYCSPFLWSIDDPGLLAHELGHALGLPHSQDPSNIMFPNVQDVGLEEDQVDTMREHAWWMLEKC